MPLYQLPVSIVLFTAAFASFIIHLLTHPHEGKIKLPTFLQDADEHQPLKDPFDVTRPEDVVDGEPIDEDAFWSRVCGSFSPAKQQAYSGIDASQKTCPHSLILYRYSYTGCFSGECCCRG